MLIEDPNLLKEGDCHLAQKQYMQGKFWGVNFCAGPVFALARTQENIIDELLSEYFAKFLGEFISVRIHAALVFAPPRLQEKNPGELFMHWFRARG